MEGDSPGTRALVLEFDTPAHAWAAYAELKERFGACTWAWEYGFVYCRADTETLTIVVNCLTGKGSAGPLGHLRTRVPEGLGVEPGVVATPFADAERQRIEKLPGRASVRMALMPGEAVEQRLEWGRTGRHEMAERRRLFLEALRRSEQV